MQQIKLAKPIREGLSLPNGKVQWIMNPAELKAERKEWQKEIKKLRSELADVKGGLAFAATTMNKLGLRQGVITGKIVNRRAEKAEAKLKAMWEWNENNKPVYPIVDMVGEVKHMHYTALRGILRDADGSN